MMFEVVFKFRLLTTESLDRESKSELLGEVQRKVKEKSVLGSIFVRSVIEIREHLELGLEILNCHPWTKHV